jgi:lipopolysaccharide transport system ATP-binding protein
MADNVITVDNLSKLYRLDHQSRRPDSFRELLSNAVTAPFQRLRAMHGKATRSTEDFWALKDVSFSVPRGSVVGLIGRNGAGKSTLLKILSRIVEPTQGSIRLRGRVASLLEVGTGFHPELTGRENIFMNGSILGMKRREIERQFDAIVSFAEIERFLDTPVKRYSSGMYVRLAFAVAAHLDPEILIVDEVLAVGDSEFQKKCLGKMQEVAQGGAGRTVVFVSHNMAAVRSLCNTAIMLKSGTLYAQGGVEKIVAEYLASARHTAEPQVTFRRPDKAKLWMASAELLINGQTSANAEMGDTLSVRVRFQSDFPTKHPRLGLVVTNAAGDKLINTNNHFQPAKELSTALQDGTITCHLGQLPLVAGLYSVSLWFGDLTTDHHVASDALSFALTEKDIWGSGRVPNAESSLLWWPSSFAVEPVQPTAAS